MIYSHKALNYHNMNLGNMVLTSDEAMRIIDDRFGWEKRTK